MRKYAFVLVLLCVLSCMTSCVYTTTTTPDVPECRYHEKTIDLVVNQSEWKFDSQLKQYYVRFDLPEITAEVYDFGNFSVHREYNAGTPDAYQVALPQSVYMSEQVSNGIIYYTQHIDYRIGVGYAEIQVTNSDYAYDPYNPESMLFRLQLIW